MKKLRSIQTVNGSVLRSPKLIAVAVWTKPAKRRKFAASCPDDATSG